MKEVFFDVKEELESGSPRSGNGTSAQANQPSVLENERPDVPEQSHKVERPHEPEVPTHSHNSQDDLPQTTWTDVMNELRSVQQLCGQVRTLGETLENNADTSHIVAGQEALSRGLSMIEDGAWPGREATRREQQRVTEVYQTKLDVC